MIEQPVKSPFWTECVNGHDLSTHGAWLYKAGGERVCRACAIEAKKPRDSKARGAFD